MLLALGVGVYVSLRMSRGPASVTIPDFTNLPEEEAARRAAESGLKLEIASERYDRLVARGRILSQDPPPGALTRLGRTVKVVRSLGDVQIPVPNLVGRAAREARLDLQQIGLRVGVASFVRWDAPEDRILAQQPRPGDLRSKGDAVNLLISRGSRPRVYVMPDLTGRPAEEAAARLERSGLRVARGQREHPPGVATGIVLSQSPAAGSPIRERDVVSLTISE